MTDIGTIKRQFQLNLTEFGTWNNVKTGSKKAKEHTLTPSIFSVVTIIPANCSRSPSEAIRIISANFFAISAGIPSSYFSVRHFPVKENVLQDKRIVITSRFSALLLPAFSQRTLARTAEEMRACD